MDIWFRQWQDKFLSCFSLSQTSGGNISLGLGPCFSSRLTHCPILQEDGNFYNIFLFRNSSYARAEAFDTWYFRLRFIIRDYESLDLSWVESIQGSDFILLHSVEQNFPSPAVKCWVPPMCVQWRKERRNSRGGLLAESVLRQKASLNVVSEVSPGTSSLACTSHVTLIIPWSCDDWMVSRAVLVFITDSRSNTRSSKNSFIEKKVWRQLLVRGEDSRGARR